MAIQEIDGIPANVQKILDQMNQESDRGTAIVTAALLDDVLGKMIEAKLAPTSNSKDELLFAGYAPLSSFSAKIDMAYRLGLIRIGYKKCMHILRDIRNDFAHYSVQKGFDNESTQQKIRNMIELNREVIDSIVGAVGRAKNDESYSLQNFIESIGWRGALEIIFSLIAAALLDQVKNIEAISVLE